MKTRSSRPLAIGVSEPLARALASREIGGGEGATLREILNALPAEGTFELVCHPGYNDRDLDRITTRLRAHRDIERNALLTELPRLALQPNAPQLINYGNLSASDALRETPIQAR